ncbi:cell division protein FtsZ [Rubritalea marina]|uniref:cell division protein FtsZ n=1 Tax=Rubritalea marina TaxID=361055 RepID=UPI00037724D6|nr:cell division protein FtsZ [Rubritalea marina]
MIEFQRDKQQTIPNSQVKIVGVGGAGLNMIDRVMLDGMQGVELLALTCDSRSLSSSVASEKIQLGAKLTMGLGCGGDPELGAKAAGVHEQEISDALREHHMVFICVGLGGGTGSGAAPVVARIARELGAFVVVFATMPFAFEGKRRRDQAESALNELSVISNALVTFENSKMGEMVLAAQGIHEAFAAADRMISESIKAVTRLVVRPGLINVGLDDLIKALDVSRSRCLFGSGIASGENRSHAALKNALSSPLLDKGKLLKQASSALIHICGGEGMTLYEVELLMRELSKNVPENAHILFGAAVDAEMGDSLSVTILSALPEGSEVEDDDVDESPVVETSALPVIADFEAEEEDRSEDAVALDHTEEGVEDVIEEYPEEQEVKSIAQEITEEAEDLVAEMEEDLEEDSDNDAETSDNSELETPEVIETPEDDGALMSIDDDAPEEVTEPEREETSASDTTMDDDALMFEEFKNDVAAPSGASEASGSQAELKLDGAKKGKFEGEDPYVVDGEDLDLPPFMRK